MINVTPVQRSRDEMSLKGNNKQRRDNRMTNKVNCLQRIHQFSFIWIVLSDIFLLFSLSQRWEDGDVVELQMLRTRKCAKFVFSFLFTFFKARKAFTRACPTTFTWMPNNFYVYVIIKHNLNGCSSHQSSSFHQSLLCPWHWYNLRGFTEFVDDKRRLLD